MISDQRGFTLIEVLVTVTILGIMAAIAIPRFDNATALANTAKIQSDLQTIDSAIVMYQMETGSDPSEISDLSSYLTDASNIKPPSGKFFLKSSSDAQTSSVKTYAITTSDNQKRATFNGNTSDKFGRASN